MRTISPNVCTTKARRTRFSEVLRLHSAKLNQNPQLKRKATRYSAAAFENGANPLYNCSRAVLVKALPKRNDSK